MYNTERVSAFKSIYLKIVFIWHKSSFCYKCFYSNYILIYLLRHSNRGFKNSCLYFETFLKLDKKCTFIFDVLLGYTRSLAWLKIKKSNKKNCRLCVNIYVSIVFCIFSVSFKLADIYTRLTKRSPNKSHEAEGDVLMLITCAATLGEKFVRWANANAKGLCDIPSMVPGKKIGT